MLHHGICVVLPRYLCGTTTVSVWYYHSICVVLPQYLCGTTTVSVWYCTWWGCTLAAIPVTGVRWEGVIWTWPLRILYNMVSAYMSARRCSRLRHLSSANMSVTQALRSCFANTHLAAKQGKVNQKYNNTMHTHIQCKKIKTICHAQDLWKLTRLVNNCIYYACSFTRYCFPQWILKLPGSFEIHWLRQYLINLDLFGIKDL